MAIRISKNRVEFQGVRLNLARTTVASHATTADIWTVAGNQIDWTGTATTTAFPNAPQGGVERTLICAGACSFTAGANMLIDGVSSGATVTCAVNDQVIVKSVSTTQFKLSRIKYDGTAQVSGGITLATAQASTSGTAIDFTGIPAGVKMINILLNGVSISSNSRLLIQIGDAGGFETSGYASSAAQIWTDASVSSTSSTAGFVTTVIGSGAQVWYGKITLSLENSSAFSWCSNGVIGLSVASVALSGGGKSLSQELSSVRVTTVSGTDTFDAGEINIAYS